MIKTSRVLFVASLTLTLGVMAPVATAAEFIVTVNAGSFSPTMRTINVGDEITWEWGGSGIHTTTHVPSGGNPVLWDEDIRSSNPSYTRAFNTAGIFNYKCDPHEFTGRITVNPAAGILDEPGIGGATTGPTNLNQNSPNPFNAATQLQYSLDKDGMVQLAVYNILGQEVATLVDGFQPGGLHTVTWDGRDSANRETPSGIYFARLVVTGTVMTRKMVLLR